MSPSHDELRAREATMTWPELLTTLERADPASEIVAALYHLRGTPDVFALEEARDTGEYVRWRSTGRSPSRRCLRKVRRDEIDGRRVAPHPI